MAYFGMLRHVAPVRTDVSKELSPYIIRVTRIGELGTTLAATVTDPRSEKIQRFGGEFLNRYRRETFSYFLTNECYITPVISRTGHISVQYVSSSLGHHRVYIKNKLPGP
jgi:hypothetical protein